MLGLSVPQVVVLAVGILTIVGALYAGGGMLLAWTAPIWLVCAVLASVPAGGRKLIEWVPIVARWVWRVTGGQLLYRRRVVKPCPAGTLALPGGAAALREWEDPETGAAMIHDPHAATLTAIVGLTHPGDAAPDGTARGLLARELLAVSPTREVILLGRVSGALIVGHPG